MLRGGSGIGEVIPGCAELWLGQPMQCVAETEKKALVVWWGNKADAHWQPGGEEAGGDGDGAEIHEVDEVGVVAEVGVELDGGFFDFGDAVGGADGGEHEHVDFFP